MNIAVVIPTVDRPDALRRALTAIRGQSQQAQVILVCPPDASRLPEDVRSDSRIAVVDGVKGLTRQRNLAVASIPESIDYIAFFDDDAVPRSDYLEKAAVVLDANPDIVGVTGAVVRDGAQERVELSADEMSAALDASWADDRDGFEPVTGLYGCNMMIRADVVRATLFDERLPLYGWLEDLDFSRRAMTKGRLVKAHGVVTVHQGSSSGGRKQHRRLGYSQICNPVYLWRKGSLEPKDLAVLVGKPVLSSLRGSIIGDERPERRERLKGMGLALGDLVRGRFTPERITEL
ncbi:MAG: glycosyltransferase [Luteococcus japonicus]